MIGSSNNPISGLTLSTLIIAAIAPIGGISLTEACRRCTATLGCPYVVFCN
ncbi:MAG: hypothetical protein HC846_12790 [Blastocatellia bacterium]|nr:hypothetical protein [Blastocatellia bacterium]